MIHAVIDTNVIVAALLTHNTESATVKVLEAIENGRIAPLYNNEILNEYVDVLSRARFHFSKDLVKRHVELFFERGVKAERVSSSDFVADPDDIVFYEVALSKDDAYLVTGNKKHFPQKPIVVTPAEMMDILAKTENR